MATAPSKSPATPVTPPPPARVYLSFLGTHTAGGVTLAPPSGAANFRVRRADHASPGDTPTISVAINASGAPVSYTRVFNSSTSIAVTFGVAASTADPRYSYRYFSNTAGVVVSADANGAMNVGVQNPFAFTVANAGTGNNAVAFTTRTYRNDVTTGTAPNQTSVTVFSQVVGAEHASFFFMYGQDIRKAHHGFYGAETPLWAVNILRAAGLEGAYTIPIGAARGHFWNHTAAADHKNFFLHNRTAGALNVDFGESEATLNLQVGSVTPAGAYTENFLNIAGLEMTLAGGTFNNYHCNAARGTGVVGGECGGTFTYAAAAGGNTATDFSTTTAIAYRVIAGGAFYGGGAQEAAGGIAHTFGSGNTRGEMVLQWLGARLGAGDLTRSLVTAAVTAAPLPTWTLPAVNLPAFSPAFGAVVTTAPAAEAGVIGGRHIPVRDFNLTLASSEVGRVNNAHHINLGSNTGNNITATIVGAVTLTVAGSASDNDTTVTATAITDFPPRAAASRR